MFILNYISELIMIGRAFYGSSLGDGGGGGNCTVDPRSLSLCTL